MAMALNTKHKLVFVNGLIPQPPSENPVAKVWLRCNSMVTYWLLNVVSKEIIDNFLYLDSAQDIWADL